MAEGLVGDFAAIRIFDNSYGTQKLPFDEYSTPLYTAQSLLLNSRQLKKLNLYDLYD